MLRCCCAVACMRAVTKHVVSFMRERCSSCCLSHKRTAQQRRQGLLRLWICGNSSTCLTCTHCMLCITMHAHCRLHGCCKSLAAPQLPHQALLCSICLSHSQGDGKAAAAKDNNTPQYTHCFYNDTCDVCITCVCAAVPRLRRGTLIPLHCIQH